VEDQKLAVDEARRTAGHEAVKAEVNQEVNEEVVRNAGTLAPGDESRIAAAGAQFRHDAVNEVVRTETEVKRARGAARVSQVIDYCFYLIYGLIALRIILDLLGARSASGFKQFIIAVSSPFLAPFDRLMADPAAGRFQLRLSYIFALVVYLLIHLAINGFLRMMAHRKTAV
jgi:uncharacterized protein YggT (Ycf19 family)